MSKKVQRPTQAKAVGYGYVGLWNDGRFGWCMPRHFSGRLKGTPDECCAHPTWSNIGEPSYLCKITLELVPNKRMRRIKE